MANRNGFARQRSFTLDEQIYRMSVACPELRVTRRQRQAEVVWTGSIRPTALSELYSVSIRLRLGWCPEARVLRPQLRPRDGVDNLPHVYGDGSLCLHFDGEWHSGMFIAETTLPWMCLWLYFYEIWHATGHWLGGGTHPNRPEHRSE